MLPPQVSLLGTQEHPLQGQADYLVNVAMMYTSHDRRDSTAPSCSGLVGKRLKALGLYPLPDVYEQPTSTLDATFNTLLLERMRMKLSLKNLLDPGFSSSRTARKCRGITAGAPSRSRSPTGGEHGPPIGHHSPHAPARSESRRRGVALTVVIGLTLAAAAAVGAASTSTAPVSRAPSVRDSPGYVPLFDPESTAEKLGRRPNAAVVSKPFRGGAQSLDALGRTVCRALHVGSKDSLMALCVTDDEFRDILWPEFPQSRPVVGLQWEDAWPILYARV